MIANRLAGRRILHALSIAGGCMLAASCRSAPAPRLAVGWRPIASFSGHGDEQTESFEMEGGRWRIKWSASHEDAPGTGTLRITVSSAVSGRPLSVALDHKGEGKGVASVTEDPRLFFLAIESAHVDWTASVEEAVVGEIPGSP